MVRPFLRINRGVRLAPQNCGVIWGGTEQNCAVVLPGAAAAGLRVSKIAIMDCIIPGDLSRVFKAHLVAMGKPCIERRPLSANTP